MKASKSPILLVAALAVSSTQAVYAGPQSLLDPYANIQAPASKSKANKSAQPKPEAVSKGSTTRSALSGEESEEKAPVEKVEKQVKAKPEKKEKALPVAKEPREEKSTKKSTPVSSGDAGVVSGIKDIQSGYVKTFKAAGSGIVNGTKAAGAKVADSTKKVRDGVASGAKSSGEYIAKSAKALGNTFKISGKKPKDAPDVLPSRVATAPKKASHSAKNVGSDSTVPAQIDSNKEAVSEKVLDDASFPGKPLEPISTKPLTKAGSNQNALGRTLAKMNVFSHSKKPAPLPTPRAAASDPARSVPN
jgi:hypothetical protein